jgi:hypothetical protein
MFIVKLIATPANYFRLKKTISAHKIGEGRGFVTMFQGMISLTASKGKNAQNPLNLTYLEA